MVNKLQKRETMIRCQHRITGALRMDLMKTMARDFNLLCERVNTPPSRPVAFDSLLGAERLKTEGFTREQKSCPRQPSIF
jgi:hypothetical protein